MKIRTAIFSVYVVATAVGFVVLMAFILWEVRPRYVESMRRTLNDTAALLAVMIEGEMLRAGTGELGLGAAWRENLPALERASGILRVYVTDAAATVVFDSAGGRDVGEDYARRPEMRAYFGESDLTALNASVVDGELRVTAPVHHGGATVGFVGVGRPLSSVSSAIWRARARLAGGGVAIAMVMVVAGWWISHKLTHSLGNLAAYAQRVRDGKDASPPQSRAHEIAALAQSFEEMRRALEGKAYIERYTQALTHEIKAPLSGIRGAAELLREDMPPEEQQRFLGNIQVETARIQHIVDQLLLLSTLDARGGKLEATSLDADRLVSSTLAALQPAAAARGVALGQPPSSTARVRGDEFLVQQALMNLVQNAVEFTPAGGRVDVTVDPDSDRIAITICDTGSGIPAYAHDRIFDRFYSLPRPDTGRKSTGLGLSFVREVAKLHGGEVTLENRAEGGVQAVLNLPRA